MTIAGVTVYRSRPSLHLKWPFWQVASGLWDGGGKQEGIQVLKQFFYLKQKRERKINDPRQKLTFWMDSYCFCCTSPCWLFTAVALFCWHGILHLMALTPLHSLSLSVSLSHSIPVSHFQHIFNFASTFASVIRPDYQNLSLISLVHNCPFKKMVELMTKVLRDQWSEWIIEHVSRDWNTDAAWEESPLVLTFILSGLLCHCMCSIFPQWLTWTAYTSERGNQSGREEEII